MWNEKVNSQKNENVIFHSETSPFGMMGQVFFLCNNLNFSKKLDVDKPSLRNIDYKNRPTNFLIWEYAKMPVVRYRTTRKTRYIKFASRSVTIGNGCSFLLRKSWSNAQSNAKSNSGNKPCSTNSTQRGSLRNSGPKNFY